MNKGVGLKNHEDKKNQNCSPHCYYRNKRRTVCFQNILLRGSMDAGKCKYVCNGMYLFLLWIRHRSQKRHSALGSYYDAIFATFHIVSYSM